MSAAAGLTGAVHDELDTLWTLELLSAAPLDGTPGAILEASGGDGAFAALFASRHPGAGVTALRRDGAQTRVCSPCVTWIDGGLEALDRGARFDFAHARLEALNADEIADAALALAARLRPAGGLALRACGAYGEARRVCGDAFATLDLAVLAARLDDKLEAVEVWRSERAVRLSGPSRSPGGAGPAAGYRTCVSVFIRGRRRLAPVSQIAAAR